MAKIVTIVRTLNEEKNIERFCRSYAWTDAILISDGGSEDNTVALARQFKNVKDRPFHEKVSRNGVWRNPEGRHINFLIDWAEEEGADWILLDDCDSAPNVHLQQNARREIDLLGKDIESLFMYRMYLYGTDKWFPDLTGVTIPPPTQDVKGNPVDWHGLWGWRPNKEIRWLEMDGWGLCCAVKDFKGISRHSFEYPNCLLHYFCLDEEMIHRKMALYGGANNQAYKHPAEIYGPMEDLPEWAHP